MSTLSLHQVLDGTLGHRRIMLGLGCGGMRVAQGAGPRADERGYGGVDETRGAAPEDMVVGVYVVSPGLDGFCQGVVGGVSTGR